jgi:hypothetical protein
MIRGFAEGPWMLARTDRRHRQSNGGAGSPDVESVSGGSLLAACCRLMKSAALIRGFPQGPWLSAGVRDSVEC